MMLRVTWNMPYRRVIQRRVVQLVPFTPGCRPLRFMRVLQ
jgi:hypothetical protein